MPRLAHRKPDSFYRFAKPRERAYLIADGDGLYLLVRPGGTKSWVFRCIEDDRPRKIALRGRYPVMSVHQARTMAEDLRRKLAQGEVLGFRKSPQTKKRELPPPKPREHTPPHRPDTFESVAGEFIQTRMAQMDPGTRRVAENRLRLNAFPTLGDRPIAAITAPELLETIRGIERRGRGETAHRVLGLCSRIFRYAVATGRRERDIASDLKGALRPKKTSNRASLTDPEEFAALMQDICAYKQGWWATQYALRLLPMVFTRPGELRLAKWSEFDLDKGLWSIPAERTKMRRPHLVPLSRQALTLLHELRGRSQSEFLFPSAVGSHKPISNVAMLLALRRMGYRNDQMCAHGFRAAARTLGAEELGLNPLHLEAQLAHKVADPLGTAYNRTTYLTERKALMQRWSDYLDEIARA